MARKSENDVVTEIAPCGLLCSRCESFFAKKCLGCYEENTNRNDRCQVLETTPFEEARILIDCIKGKGVAQCQKCEMFENCEIYEAMLLKCPFKRPTYDLKPGFGYIVNEKKPELSFKIFSNMARHGSDGLSISRQHPKNLKIILGRGDIETYWLTSLEGNGNIDPTDIGILSDLIIRFIEKHRDTIILLDGLELLITHNDFPKVIRMVNHITEQVMQHNARFMITVDERTLDKKELALLERNMEVVET